ncbi:hypothetical protein PIB30_114266, partial [Stylosanthes scabra]|nr:hypothetical protein [Stylosanthes scabra]
APQNSMDAVMLSIRKYLRNPLGMRITWSPRNSMDEDDVKQKTPKLLDEGGVDTLKDLGIPWVRLKWSPRNSMDAEMLGIWNTSESTFHTPTPRRPMLAPRRQPHPSSI